MAEMQSAEVPAELWAAFDAGEDACWSVEGHDANWLDCCRKAGLAAALKLHEQQVRERIAAEAEAAWTEWQVRVQFRDGATEIDYEDETDASIKYRKLLADPAAAERLVAASAIPYGRVERIELLSRTNMQGAWRVVEDDSEEAGDRD